MNTENMEKIRKYKAELEKELKDLKEERKEILNKVNNGESLSRKENKRNQELATLIKDLQDKLKPFDSLDLFAEMSNSLDKISETKTSKTEKDKLIKKLLTQFKKFNDTNKKELKNLGNLTDKDLKDLDKLKQKTENELQELENELKVLQKRDLDTKDVKEEIEEKKYILELIRNYENDLLDLTKVEQDLKKLADNKTSKEDKMAIMITYNTIINQYQEVALKDIETLNIEENKPVDAEYTILDQEEQNDKKSLKERTKEKLAKISEKLKKNKKTIKRVFVGSLLVVCIIVVAKSCNKNIENSKNNEDTDNLNNKTTIETIYENADSETIKALTDKGYDEFNAMLMAKNFDNNTIKALKTIPYNQNVENYATVSEFKIDYLNDYETARTVYNIAADKSVDYVNRSAKIKETEFYNGATINDIVAVVKAVDEQDLFRAENGQLEHSINAELTDIYNNYAFTNNSNEENAKKLEAFKYFAKEGSDLDKFLTEFATLTQDVLNTKNDTEKSSVAKKAVYTYIDTFANTFAGNSYDIENPNENAIVTDTYDWNIAYSSFIKPLISMYITEENVNDFVCLQTNMLSNYEQWAQVNGCVLEQESLILGGE